LFNGLFTNLLFLHVFMAIVSITTLILAVAIGERDRAKCAAESCFEQERMARVRAELLAEVSTLLSSVFDYPRVLHELTRLCVRSIADWAVVDLIEEDGVVHRLAGAHRRPRLEPLLRELEASYPASILPRSPAAAVLAGGCGHFPELSEADVRARAKDARHAEILMKLGTATTVAVALKARGVLLGALTLCSATPDRYQPADIELAEELARRAALAIDNARLNLAERRALARLARMARAARDMANTPLQTITLSVSLLRDSSGDQRELQRIDRAVERLRRLDELLASYSDQYLWSEEDLAFDAEEVLGSGEVKAAGDK
jgi:GAF domain-containing protein